MRFLGVAAAVLAVSATSHAADLPLPAGAIEAPPPQIFSWTGFQIGMNGGWGWNDTEAGVQLTDPGGAFFGACLAAGACPTNGLEYDVDGFLIGGRASADWQTGMWVLGVAGDLNYSDMEGSDSATVVSAFGTFVGSARSDYDWFATARARAGAAFGRILVFGTGGVAFANVEDSGTWGFLPNNYVGGQDETLFGWTAGGGIDFALTNNIVLGGEALYFDLEDNEFDLTPQFVPPAGTNVRAQFEHTGVVARGHVSFKW